MLYIRERLERFGSCNRIGAERRREEGRSAELLTGRWAERCPRC